MKKYNTIKYDGKTIEILATIFPSRISEDILMVNYRGQYYHISLSKIKKVIERHKKIHDIQKAQKKFDEKKGNKKWRRKHSWGGPITALISASIWRFRP